MNGDTAATLARIRDESVREVRIVFADYNGLLRARSLSVEHLQRVLEGGVNFSSPTVDFNSRDLFPGDAAFDLTSPDFWARPDPSTYRPSPAGPQIGEVLADLVDADGQPWLGCPRTQLRTVVERASGLGYSFQIGFEPEGYVLRPGNGVLFVDTPKFATLDGLDVEPEIMRDLLAYLADAGITVEQWSEEYGPGQIEVNLRYGPAGAAADAVLVYKHAFRTLARRHNLLGTFMPKPFGDAAGSGLHVHISAVEVSGRNTFDGGGNAELGLSELARHALAGLLQHGPALTALGASTVNSYKRFLPGSWAPTDITYAYASRAAFVRIPERRTARRLELRVGDAACNPHIYLTGIIAAMLDGIERGLDPGRPVSSDMTEPVAGTASRLPRTLAEALDCLQCDHVIQSALGPVIAAEYVKIKRSEWEAFTSHVGQWDRDWYLTRY